MKVIIIIIMEVILYVGCSAYCKTFNILNWTEDVAFTWTCSSIGVICVFIIARYLDDQFENY